MITSGQENERRNDENRKKYVHEAKYDWVSFIFLYQIFILHNLWQDC